MACSSKIIIIIFFIFLILAGLLIGFVLHKYGWAKKERKENPLVETKLGSIEGLWASDGNYSMFLGVPYAIVNETNPFGNSIPYPKFKEVFKAHDDSELCPQREPIDKTYVGSLDCLNLNIYIPNSVSSDRRLPVLAYIYGGSYEIGLAGRFLYGPKYLMRKDIILVVFNYRVALYGFLCLNIPDIPGNQGLKDQIDALKWIKENIESFGGDPDRVTITGVSSGGENVFLHLLYEKELLFNQVIILSGLTAPPLITIQANVDVPQAIAADLGFKTKSMHEALKFIAAKDSNSVIRSSTNLNITYKPCVEKPFKNVDRFITNYTVNMFDTPNLKKVSILIEEANNEQLYIYANKDLQRLEYENIFRDEINSLFDFDNATLKRMSDYIRRFYIGDEDIDEQVKQNIVDFSSDIYHNYPIKRVIDKFLVNGAKKVYYSIFSYVGERNFLRDSFRIKKSYNGSTHSDYIGYLFDVSYMKDRNSDEDLFIVDRMTTLFANFVKYGDPTPETTKLLPIKWKPVSNNSNYDYYNINTEITTGFQPFHERIAFWDLFYKLNGKYERLIRKTN